KGIKKVFISEYGPAIVIADNTWRAAQAARALRTTEDGANTDLSTASINAKINELLKSPPIEMRVQEGDATGVLNSKSDRAISARYDVPYLAHATMEPMNCTVLVKDGKCECWVGHQAASVVHNLLNESTGIDKANIKINTTYLGGGFGRRGEPDFVRYAGAAAKEMPGVPVQVVFTREEDMLNDTYRPAAACEFKAVVSEQGEIEAFSSMSVLQSCQHNALMRIMPAMAAPPEKDETTVEGIEDLPYAMQSKQVAFGDLDLPIQVGFWRSVGYSQNSFFAECFMDECAHAAQQDPYQFRKSKLGKHPRFAAVLNKVAEMANWNTPLPAGKFRGIALVKSYGSIVGEVAEISKIGDKQFKIDKYYCAIDCGNAINPNTIEAQIQGGVIFGLSAALYGEITWEDGAVVQQNFPQYEMVRLNVCPEIEVHVMDVDEHPGGVGEPGVPPTAPALVNALFAATGERVRSLPLKKQGYRFV
ncbi:MAG: xanthine dehydrogenase family protein molybdopterin-binding subunit, partial [Saprospiraceae bacterium]